MDRKKWIVGTDGGVLLVHDVEFTTKIEQATIFEHIGDAMRECVRLNNIDLGFASKFKMFPV